MALADVNSTITTRRAMHLCRSVCEIHDTYRQTIAVVDLVHYTDMIPVLGVIFRS